MPDAVRPGLGVRLASRLLSDAAAPLAAVAVSFAAGGLLIAAIGQNPFFVYAEMLRGTFGSLQAIGQVLFKTTPLIFTGLSVALAFRAGLFNIGAEGQAVIGAYAAAVAGIAGAGLPGAILAPLCIAASFAGGALWGFVPGWLRARRGTHEVISTIMLNFIAVALTGYFVTYVTSVPETIHTPEIGAGARLPRLDAIVPGLRGAPVNLSLLIALALAVAVHQFLFRTRLGYEIRAVGLAPDAAGTAGIPVGRRLAGSLALSGGLAGLVGTNYVLGYKYYFQAGFSGGVGFMGIAVALLGRNHPAGVVAAALLFGVLSHGGLMINRFVPKELIDILEAVVILAVIGAAVLLGGLPRRGAAREAA